MPNKSNLQSIVIAQKRVVRIVAKVNRLEHTNVLFERFSILKFTDLVKLKIALVVHKAKLKLLPPNLQVKFRLNVDSTYRSLRSLGMFKICFFQD